MTEDVEHECTRSIELSNKMQCPETCLMSPAVKLGPVFLTKLLGNLQVVIAEWLKSLYCLKSLQHHCYVGNT